MLYVIVEGENVKRVMLVKGENKEEIESRINLKEGEVLVGTFITSELAALESSSFAVVSN